ncbi:unnamed protein product [Paramecium sonneborni]|uniref:Uncharacterized protein n=1 Tax=Paramecium sonneborni TaxID=65129 RepID=A0A8S1QBL5_9CILI|nr:unnamed protein product [Paramecium sonneborni]
MELWQVKKINIIFFDMHISQSYIQKDENIFDFFHIPISIIEDLRRKSDNQFTYGSNEVQTNKREKAKLRNIQPKIMECLLFAQMFLQEFRIVNVISITLMQWLKKKFKEQQPENQQCKITQQNYPFRDLINLELISSFKIIIKLYVQKLNFILSQILLNFILS